jgi:hypothetical protein
VRPGGSLIAALAVAAVALAAAACDPDESTRPLGTAPTDEPLTLAGEAARVDASWARLNSGARPIASVAAAPPVLPPAAGAATGSSAASAKTRKDDAAAPGAAAKPAPTACGDAPAPPCPLAAWMKANASPAITKPDFDALAETLDQTVALAPGGYPNWGSIARDGAAAARAQDLKAVKASCRSCHTQYRSRYRAELRGRPLAI